MQRLRKSEGSHDKRKRLISILDLVIILDNIYRAAKHKDIGFEDPRETMTSFIFRMDRKVSLYTEDIESGLWSCNLLNEKGKFRHPKDWTFEKFLEKMLSGDKFNKDYNYIEDGDGSVI